MQPPKIKIQVKIDAEIDDVEEGTQQGVDDRDGHAHPKANLKNRRHASSSSRTAGSGAMRSRTLWIF